MTTADHRTRADLRHRIRELEAAKDAERSPRRFFSGWRFA